MIQSAVILAALLALPPFFQDAGMSRDERAELYRPVAVAIAEAARTPEEAAFLEVQAFAESGMAKNVLTGHCELMPKGMRCDPDKHGVPRARGPWQLWRVACKADDLRGQAKCVLGIGKLGLQRCASWSGAFGALTGRWACVAMPAREQRMRRVLATWGKR